MLSVATDLLNFMTYSMNLLLFFNSVMVMSLKFANFVSYGI